MRRAGPQPPGGMWAEPRRRRSAAGEFAARLMRWPRSSRAATSGQQASRPAGQQVAGELIIDSQAAGGAEQDVAGLAGVRGRVPAAYVMDGDLLVYRVGFDVLVKVPARLLIPAQPPDSGGVAPVRAGGGHLQGGQVAQQHSEPAPVQGKQRHHVADRQGHYGNGRNVAAVAVIQTEPAHSRAEQLGVHPRPAADHHRPRPARREPRPRAGTRRPGGGLARRRAPRTATG
jgi:hypothetical protein